jgi:hypothetical protein
MVVSVVSRKARSDQMSTVPQGPRSVARAEMVFMSDLARGVIHAVVASGAGTWNALNRPQTVGELFLVAEGVRSYARGMTSNAALYPLIVAGAAAALGPPRPV